MPAKKPPLWKCPNCGLRFITRNMWHSCKLSVALGVHFQYKPAAFRSIFNRVRTLLRACGPVTIYARSSGIVFQVRVRFGGVRIRNKYVLVSLWLENRAEHPCVVRTVSFRQFESHGDAHYFHFTEVGQLDRGFALLVEEAYAVGAQTSRQKEGDKTGTRRGKSGRRPARLFLGD
jgi:hypothetical protein